MIPDRGPGAFSYINVKNAALKLFTRPAIATVDYPHIYVL